MAKKKDYNVLEINGKTYTVAERVREESNVREIPYTINEFVREVDNGEIRRDPLIQRTDDQWVRKQKSKLVEAVLHNRPIGSIALAKGRAESKSYTVTSLVDGLQRTTALVDFFHDCLTLDKRANPVLCRLIDNNGNEIKEQYEIAGKKYSQLPDAIKNFFNKYRLTTYMHEGFTDEELDDIVFCMNNGKTPNSYQKIRFLLGSDNMRPLQPICDSTLWEESKGCKAKNDSILCIVVRTLMMLTHYNYNNLGSASMTKFAENDFDNYVTEKIVEKLSALVEELAEIKYNLSDNELEKFNAITIPHYIMALDSFHTTNANTEIKFIDVLRNFWESDYYQTFNGYCESNGSGGSLYSAQTVEDRQYAIYDFLDEYLDVADNDDNDDECEADKEDEHNTEKSGTEADTAGDSEIEGDPDGTTADAGTMPTDGGGCKQTSYAGQEEQTGSVNLSGREFAVESA